MTEHHPGYNAWTIRELDLLKASIELVEDGLVRVVEPADGERPDLVEVTDVGRAALD